MLEGQLKINGKDAYTTWGLFLEETALSALLAPAPNKAYIANDNRLENGTRIAESAIKVGERDLTLTLNLSASTENDFFSKYASFCSELAKGKLNIETSFQPGVTYHCYYISCTQFSQFMRGIGKFALKLTEPNPTNRT